MGFNERWAGRDRPTVEYMANYDLSAPTRQEFEEFAKYLVDLVNTCNNLREDLGKLQESIEAIEKRIELPLFDLSY